MNHLASEMAKRVRITQIGRRYGNVDNFMHSVEEAFVESNARPIAVILSRISEGNRLWVTDENDETSYRDANLGEYQDLFTTLGYPSNCFRCREGEGLSGEFFIQVQLPHPFNMR